MSTMGEVGAVPDDDDRASVPPPSGPPHVTRAPGASTVVTPTGWPAPPSPQAAPTGRPQPVGYPPVAPVAAPTQAHAPAPTHVPASAGPVGVPARPAPLPPPRDLVPAPPIPAPAPSRPAYSMPSEPFTAPRPARLAPEPVARRLAGRRSRLTVRRLEPWSVFVMSLLLTLFLAVMTVIAALVLYFVLDSVGAVASINRGVDDVKGNGDILSLGRFVGLAALVAAANVVFLTALSTLGAVVYNFCATFAGGIDITLAEGE